MARLAFPSFRSAVAQVLFDFAGVVAALAAEGADASEFPGVGPFGDGLGVYTEHAGYLSGGETGRRNQGKDPGSSIPVFSRVAVALCAQKRRLARSWQFPNRDVKVSHIIVYVEDTHVCDAILCSPHTDIDTRTDIANIRLRVSINQVRTLLPGGL